MALAYPPSEYPLGDFFNPGPGPIVETVSINPKDALGVKKVSLHLIPPASKIYQATAMEDGASKYGPYNWRSNKVRLTIYLDAAERHLACYLDGEEIAEDSGVHHLAHALGCIGIVVDAKETGNLIDDRPIKGIASQLINKYKKME